MSQTFLARHNLAARRKDRADAHQVLARNTRIPKGQLKGGQPFPVFPDALREEQLLRDHAFSQFLCALHKAPGLTAPEPFRVEFKPIWQPETETFRNSCGIYAHRLGSGT